VTFNNGGATLNYLAQYYAVAAPTAGAVQALVNYAIDYL
jgi:type 1 fimbria pilin